MTFRIPGYIPIPIAYWSMNNADFVGNVINDPLSQAHATTVNGPTVVDANVGQGRYLNGVNQYMAVSNKSLFDFQQSTPFSFSVWVNTTSSASSHIFGKAGNGGNATSGYVLEYSGGIIFRFMNQFGTITSTEYTAFPIHNGKWRHCVVTYDGLFMNGFTFYIDGVAAPKKVFSTDDPGNILNNIQPSIGSRGVAMSAPGYFEGSLSELAVWDLELSPKNVFDIYSRGGSGYKLLDLL